MHFFFNHTTQATKRLTSIQTTNICIQQEYISTQHSTTLPILVESKGRVAVRAIIKVVRSNDTEQHAQKNARTQETPPL